MSQRKRTGRRAASKLATTSHPSAPAAFLPQVTTRAMRRGRQRLLPAATVDATANFGAVLEFTQPNGQAEIDFNPAGVSTDQATYEVWIKTTVKTQQMLFQTAYSQPNIFIQNDQIGVQWAGAGNGWLSADTTPISDGEWHHVAVVFANGAMTFYKDGLPTADALSVSTSTGANHPVFIGGTWAGIPAFIGQMWNVKIWSVALTAAQIQSDLYTAYPGNAYPANLALFTIFNVATNTVTNSTGNVAGTLTNAVVTWDALPQVPTYALEIPGGAGDYVGIGSLSASVDSTASTFECWLKMSTAPGVSATPQTILVCPNPPFAAPSIAYSGNNGGDLFTVTWGSGSGLETVNLTSATRIADGAWHHVAAVFNQNQITLYVDGLPVATGSFPTSVTQTAGGDLQVGTAFAGAQAFNGLITDVRVWSVARSVGDIQSFMYSTLTGKEPGLVGLNNLSYYSPFTAPILGIRNQVNNAQGALNGNAKVVRVVGPQSQQPVPQNIWTFNISGIAPLGPQISPKGLIYAENVAASGSGPAGNYLRSLDLQDHTLNWTYSVHDNSAIPTPVIPASVGLGNTVAYVVAQAQDTTGSNVVELHAVDFTTGQPVWDGPAKLATNYIVSNPVEAGSVVLIGGPAASLGGYGLEVFAVETGLGQVHSTVIPIKGIVDFMSDALIRNVNATNSSTSDSITMAYFFVSYLPGVSQVVALNLTNQTVVWQIQSPYFLQGGLTMDQDRLYAVSEQGSIVAMNLADGSTAWSKSKTNLAIKSAPVVIGTAVYVGSTDGSLYAFDGATGNDLWQLNAGSAITTDLITEDGAIYFATQGNGKEMPPTFFSVDAASLGNDVLIYPVPEADTILFDQGQSNGVAYFYSQQNVYAVNMDMILHEFNVDTKLTVEDYDTSSSTPSDSPTGNDTSYRITLALNDPLKAPRVNQAVKVWASGAVYLSNIPDSHGNPTVIGPTTPLWIQTDGSGQVSLAVSAYDDGSHGGTGSTASPLVNCPAIYAWANFMMPGEAIVIYPDHEHLGNLSNVQGNSTTGIARSHAVQSTLYLNQATAYDGSQLISSKYRDSTSLTNCAATIRNAIGTRNSASASAPNGVGDAAPANKYIAYPASMPNVNYASDNTQPTTRPFVPGADPIFTMDISGASGQATVYQNTYDDSRPSNLPPPSTVATGVVTIQMADGTLAITSIGSYFRNVVKGAEKVAKVAWKRTANAVNTVIHTAESVYNLVITSLEDAVTAVVGFLKSVVNDIKKAIEWLSALFNFKNILANHRLIKSFVTNNSQTGALDQMQVWIKKQIGGLGSGTSDVDAIFGQLVGQGQSSMNNTGQGLAGQTVQSVQGQNTNPNDVYNTGGQNNATQCKFMGNKMFEGSGQQLNAPPPIRPRHHYLPWVAQQPASASPMPLSVGSGPDSGTIINAWETFVTSVLDTVANDFKDFPDQLHAKLDVMKDKLKDPKSILSNGLTDLLAVLQVLADDMINLGKAIAADFLTLMDSLLVQIALWLTKTLEIPFISRLYKFLTGDDLTFLDVFALVVAVPATILLEVIAGTPTPTALIAAGAGVVGISSVAIDKVGQIFLGITNFLASIGAALIDAYMFAWSASSPDDGDLPPFSSIDLAVDVLVWAEGMAISQAWNTWQAQDWGFWAVQAVPMIYNFVFLFKSIPTTAQVVIDTIYGVSAIIISAVYADKYPSNYKDAPKATGIVLAANLFAGFGYPVELGALAGNENGGPEIAAIGKLIFGVVAAVLTFVGYVENVVHPSAMSAPTPTSTARLNGARTQPALPSPTYSFA